jgi:pimeloyl-ACP methyl ester carboxylesterase
MDLFRFYPETFFEPDYEHVLGTVIDHLSKRPEIDMDRLALMGISFGGYFVTRAAAHEPRIKALIANSPVLDLHAYLAAFVGYDPAEAPEEENFTLQDLPRMPDDVMPRQFKEMTENVIIRFGQPSFKDTFVYLRQFVVGDAVANIRCPCLALVGSGEGGEPEKQFHECCAKVSGPVTSHRFTELEGADTHCQVGNPAFSAAVAMDWLDELFDS